MIKKRQSVPLIHVLTKLFIKSDINEQKMVIFKIKNTYDLYVINEIFQKVSDAPLKYPLS